MKAQQQALVDALLGRGEPPAGLTRAGRGLAAYRSNLRALSARALAQPHALLATALGEDEFASLAWSFWRHHPPERGDLAQWGGALEAYLLERAGAASGLPGLARLGWALHEAERAADAELDADSLALLGSAPAETLQLRLRPGVALLELEAEALAQLGQADVAGGPALIWRQAWRGQWQRIPAADARFVRALLDGVDLQRALEAAAVKGSAAEPDFDIGAWLQAALQQTWLQGVGQLDSTP